MKKQVRPGRWIGVVAALSLTGFGLWYFLAHRGGSTEKKEAEEAPTASVRVAPLRRGSIERTLTAYGSAAPAPGGVHSVAFPLECRVVSVTANVGQSVAAGDALLQIEPSADARLTLDTARSAQAAADKALRDAQSRFQAHLATNADLEAAQSAAQDARLKLQSLRGRSPDGDGTVKAPATGIVTRLPAAPGSVVPAGGPLVELVVENRFEARLGIVPADAAGVRAGQGVHLFAVQGRGSAKEPAREGTVRVVGASVDPATRLVDAFVALGEPSEGAAPVLIGAYLRAEIVLEKKDALLAPRAAVLPAEDGSAGGTVFTVEGSHAVKHTVQTGIDDGENVEITGDADGLRAGTGIVTEGNYELEDKMAVEVDSPEKDKDKDKDDAPASGEAAIPAPLNAVKVDKASAGAPKDDGGDARRKEDKTP